MCNLYSHTKGPKAIRDLVRELSAWTVLLAASLTITVAASAKSPQQLENKEFGFRATVPVGTVICDVTHPGGHLHGYSMLLHPTKQGCQTSVPQSYIVLVGNYNAPDYTNARQSLGSLCPRAQVSDKLKNNAGVTFSGYASYSCRAGGKDGWIDVFVSALAGKYPTANGASEAPYIIYTAQLHTTAERLDEDMVTFKKFLSGTEINAK